MGRSATAGPPCPRTGSCCSTILPQGLPASPQLWAVSIHSTEDMHQLLQSRNRAPEEKGKSSPRSQQALPHAPQG